MPTRNWPQRRVRSALVPYSRFHLAHASAHCQAPAIYDACVEEKLAATPGFSLMALPNRPGAQHASV